MKPTTENQIKSILEQQRAFFSTHKTKELKFRIEQLKKFKAAILKYEEKIANALWIDLHKSYEEAYLTEISIVLGEIEKHLKHIRRWSKPKRIKTPLALLPSSSKIVYEPLGVSLIVAPWNYPFQLLMAPVAGAISTGCTVVLKPSPYTPNIAKVMEEMIADTFESKYIATTQGGREVNQMLFDQRFDIIFYTGSPNVGKVVMKAASQHLTPVVLELGGKSPCIVDHDANIEVAAKRIVWGKTINSGQTCIAPDYLFVHKSQKEKLIAKIIENIELMFGKDVKQSNYFPRIVNDNAMKRLKSYLEDGNIRYGGQTDDTERFFHPTLLENVKTDSSVMQEEIFGPILPILEFENIDEVIEHVNKNEKPLAFYYFGKNKKAKDVLNRTTSGGGCINDTLMHIANDNLPFGGVGNSGLGKYHGKDSFLAFSNARAIVTTPTWIDLPLKYAPFKRFKLIKKLL